MGCWEAVEASGGGAPLKEIGHGCVPLNGDGCPGAILSLCFPASLERAASLVTCSLPVMSAWSG